MSTSNKDYDDDDDDDDNMCGTHRAETFFIIKFSLKIECALPIETPTDSAMKSTDSCRSFMTSLSTFSAVSSLTAADGCPQRCESSHDDLSRLNSSYHFVTVEYAGADFPNVYFISVKIFCGISPLK